MYWATQWVLPEGVEQDRCEGISTLTEHKRQTTSGCAQHRVRRVCEKEGEVRDEGQPAHLLEERGIERLRSGRHLRRRRQKTDTLKLNEFEPKME